MSESIAVKAKPLHREMIGRVVSNKMQKTVVVSVEKTRRHPLYKRTVRLSKKYFAHDESDALQIGDQVRIIESRPLSRLKRWRVAEVVRKGQGQMIAITDPSASSEDSTVEEAT